jgi:hypothetical protein
VIFSNSINSKSYFYSNLLLFILKATLPSFPFSPSVPYLPYSPFRPIEPK